jgi:hypothetical protein
MAAASLYLPIQSQYGRHGSNPDGFGFIIFVLALIALLFIFFGGN